MNCTPKNEFQQRFGMWSRREGQHSWGGDYHITHVCYKQYLGFKQYMGYNNAETVAEKQDEKLGWG